MYPAETGKLLHRTGTAGKAVGDIDLHNFVARTLTGVGDPHADGQSFIRRDFRRGELQIRIGETRIAQPVAEEIARRVGQVHIVHKTDAFPLVPSRAIGVVVIDGDLSGVIGHRDRQLAAGIVVPQQRVSDRLSSALGRAPGLQNGAQTFIRRIAGDRPPVEVDADQRLSILSRRPDKGVLTGREIDVCGIHAFAHGGHGAGAVLAAQSQEHRVRVLDQSQCLREAALVRTGYVIAPGIDDLCLRQPCAEFFQQAFAARLLTVKDRVEFLALVGLDVRVGDGFDLFRCLHHPADPGNGIGDGIGGLHHAQMGIAAEEFAGTVGMGTDDCELLDVLAQRQRAVVFQQHERFSCRAQGQLPILRLRKSLLQRLALQGEGVLEEPHAELGRQHAQYRAVKDRDIRLAALEHGFEFPVPAAGRRQFHVHPGLHAAQPGLGEALADMLN